MHYRGRDALGRGDSGGHTVETRAMIVLVTQLLATRNFKTAVKRAGLVLCTEIVRAAVASIAYRDSPTLILQHKDGPRELVLVFDEAGVTQSLADLRRSHPAASRRYNSLAAEGWHGFKVCGPLERCALPDVLAFGMWSYAHRADGRIWTEVGQPLYNCMVYHCGMLVERFVLEDC